MYVLEGFCCLNSRINHFQVKIEGKFNKVDKRIVKCVSKNGKQLDGETLKFVCLSIAAKKIFVKKKINWMICKLVTSTYLYKGIV